MSDFEPAFQFMISNEVGLEQNPNDPGGITNLGLSLRFLNSIPRNKQKSYGLRTNATDDRELLTPNLVIDLNLDTARPIYKGEFWDNAPFAQIPYQKLCNVIFDAACNVGIAQAIKFVQRAIWAAQGNQQALLDDGILGKDTLRFIKLSGFSLLPAIRSERAGYYRMLEVKVPNDQQFEKGWLKRAYTA